MLKLLKLLSTVRRAQNDRTDSFAVLRSQNRIDVDPQE
jgi:hypothetical protein